MNPGEKNILVSKWLSNELTEAELAQMEKLVESDPTMVEQYQNLWAAAESYQPKIPAAPSAWDTISREIKNEKAKPKIKTISWPLRIAASFILLVGAYVLMQMINPKAENSNLYTATSSNEKVELHDGSVVWLNEGALLRYPDQFSGQNRTVELEGEAFFDVTKSNTPFTIITQTGEVTVLGTTFEVESSDLQTEVTVATGRVQLTSAQSGKSIIIKPNEKGLHHVKSQKISLTKMDNLNDISWHTGMISFNNSPLSEVITSLSDLFNTDIKIQNEHMLLCRYTSPLTDTDLDKTLEVFAKAFDFSVNKSDDQILLLNGNCK